MNPRERYLIQSVGESRTRHLVGRGQTQAGKSWIVVGQRAASWQPERCTLYFDGGEVDSTDGVMTETQAGYWAEQVAEDSPPRG